METTEFRAWLIPFPPGKPISIPVNTLNEAILAINSIVATRDYLNERFGLDWDTDVSGLEYKDSDGDWVDFSDRNGNDFDAFYNNQECCIQDNCNGCSNKDDCFIQDTKTLLSKTGKELYNMPLSELVEG